MVKPKRDLPSESQLPSKKRKASLDDSLGASSKGSDNKKYGTEPLGTKTSVGQNSEETTTTRTEETAPSKAPPSCASSSSMHMSDDNTGKNGEEKISPPLPPEESKDETKDLPPPTAKRRATTGDPSVHKEQHAGISQSEDSLAVASAPPSSATAAVTTTTTSNPHHPKSNISIHRLPSKKRSRLDSQSTSASSQQSQHQQRPRIASISSSKEQRQRLDSLDKSIARKFSVGDLSLTEFGDRKLSITSQEQGSTKSGATEDRKLSFDLNTGKPAVGRNDSESDRKLSLDYSGGGAGAGGGDDDDVAVGVGARKESLGGETTSSHNSRKLSFDLDDVMNMNSSQEGSQLQQDSSKNNNNGNNNTVRRHRTSSLSSLDEDLTRRKWSQDSTLLEFSPSRRVAGNNSGLPKFDDIMMMGAATAPKLPDVGGGADDANGKSDGKDAGDFSLSMKAPPPVDAITMTTAVISSLTEVKLAADSKSSSSKAKQKADESRRSRDRKDSAGDGASDGNNHDRRKESISSSLDSGAGEDSATGRAAAAAGEALEHLDALHSNNNNSNSNGKDAKTTATSAKAAGERKESIGDEDDTASTAASFASKEQRVLLEAIALTAGGGGSGSVGVGRDRLESIGSQGFLLGRERFESMGSMLDAGGLLGSRRERLESWGGMSDLSGLHLGGGSNHAGGAAVDIMAMAEEANLHDINNPSVAAVPNRIAMGRDRLNSIASLSEASLTGLPTFEAGADMATIDIQAVVSATMASMGGQLAEMAGAVEAAAGIDVASTDEDLENNEVVGIRATDDSEVSSAASPMIGAAADRRGRARSSSINSGVLSVDHEALAVAVDAAHAAAAALDLATIGKPGDSVSSEEYRKKSKRGKGAARRTNRRQLPLKTRGHGESTISETEQVKIRERARAAASARDPLANAKCKPLKKRAKRKSPESKSNSPSDTPKHANRQIVAPDGISSALMPPALEPSSLEVPKATKAKSGTGEKANQKWEAMFEHLLTFINERREEETKGATDHEKHLWIWDGNVPTNKEVDGKKLGRWVNNQRTAKSKGSLKEDRSRRLEEAGLKWNVLSSNSWNDSLHELKEYIKEQTKNGGEWDGNVPTNYIIKARPDGQFAGEDRNLGRWVNRQRSQFHAGKLKKERKAALDNLGLKWSMLDSTSWEGMYQLLVRYIQEKKEATGKWDGNVPAGYKTKDDPPRNLGRWINRQRTANVKRKLKQDQFERLNALGLKWSIHDRKLEGSGRTEMQVVETIKGDEAMAAGEQPVQGFAMANGASSNAGVVPDLQLSVTTTMKI